MAGAYDNPVGGGGGNAAPESTVAQAQAGTGTGADRMSARRTKAAIAAQAPTATRHLVRFAAQDADTEPSIHLRDGEIGFFAEDGSTQVQDGDVAAARVIYLPKKAAAFGANAASPSADLDAYDITPLGDNLVANPGSDVIIALTAYGQTETVWFQAALIEAYGTQGYELSRIQHLRGSYTPASYGTGWNVVVARTHGGAVSDIIDAVDKLVFRTDLEGHKSDIWVSYDNALFGSDYFSGNWCWFTGDTEPTDDTRAVGQPDIASGSGVFVVGRGRSDKDPKKVEWGPALSAADYPAGRVIHGYVQGSANPGHVKITLTHDGALAGSGDQARVWVRATLEEVGDVGPAANGNWWQLSEYAPPGLDIRIPAGDVIDPPWVDETGAGTGDTPVTQASFMPVRSPAGVYEDKSVAHMGDHIRPRLTAPQVLSATYEATFGDIEAGDGKINVGAVLGGSATVTWGVRAAEALDGGGNLPKADILSILTLHHRITVYTGSAVFKGTISGYGGGVGAYPYQVTVSDATKAGAFGDGDAIKIKLESALVDRDELADVAFSGELTDLENMPDVPASNGAYRLRATRSGQGVAFSWVAD